MVEVIEFTFKGTAEELLTILDALANQVTVTDVLTKWDEKQHMTDFVVSEGAADAHDTYQKVAIQLHEQGWWE